VAGNACRGTCTLASAPDHPLVDLTDEYVEVGWPKRNWTMPQSSYVIDGQPS
jgi:hypothetical protein